MKKIIIIFLTILIVLNTNNFTNDDLLRIRIIANSNSEHDQQIKTNIVNNLELKLYNLLKDVNSKTLAKNLIKSNMDNIENIVIDNLENENYGYEINYGLNYFPEKTYNGKKYKEGNYESLLITLGEGKGENWWCILFPPLCLIEAEENEEVEYSFFLQELFNKIF